MSAPLDSLLASLLSLITTPAHADERTQRRDDLVEVRESSPIDNLPVELLLQIIALSMVEVKYRRLNQLMRVSRHWKNAIIAYPLFWRRIDYHDGKSALYETLGRNPFGPLHIRLADVPVRHSTDEEFLAARDFILALLPEAPRCLSLKGSWHPGLPRFLSAATSLRILSISIPKAFAYIYVFDLPTNPLLSSLSLSNARLRWGPQKLNNLKHLSLHNVSILRDSSLMLSLLKHMPNLVSLSLNSLDEWTPDKVKGVPSDPEPEESVDLPNLVALRFSRVPRPFVQTVGAGLNAKSLARLSLDRLDPENPPLPDHIIPLPTLVKRLLHTAAKIVVIYDSSSYCLEIHAPLEVLPPDATSSGTDLKAIHLVFPGMTIIHWNEVVGILEDVEEKDLHVRLAITYPTNDPYLSGDRFLIDLPWTDRLTLTGPGDDIVLAIHTLLQGDIHNIPIPVPTRPALTCLQIGITRWISWDEKKGMEFLFVLLRDLIASTTTKFPTPGFRQLARVQVPSKLAARLRAISHPLNAVEILDWDT